MNNNRMRFYALLITLVFLMLGVVVAAPAPTDEQKPEATNVETTKVQDPITMLQGISNNVLRALQNDSRPNDLNHIYSLVDKFILPYVDFNEMSQWVAGRTIWNKATQQTRDEFVSAFKILVVRTYATALKNYTNERVEFSKQKLDLNKERIQVSSTIVRQSSKGDNIRLDYRLLKKDNKWYVYDIIIEGVSILQGFQAQFSNDIRKNGLPKVITVIQQHNREKHA